jgi:hypothetical protein
MPKFDVVQDAQDSWLRKPHPFFCSAITVQAALIPASNSNQNNFSFQLQQEKPNPMLLLIR